MIAGKKCEICTVRPATIFCGNNKKITCNKCSSGTFNGIRNLELITEITRTVSLSAMCRKS